MSLRMSSLDPNEPRAAKDCRTCNRRRIRCDRSLPTCKKCALKDLSCPGYGLRIQFGQGVASRGKLMGKALPIIEPAPQATLDETLSLRSLTPAEYINPNEEVESRETSLDTGTDPITVPDSLRNAFRSSYDERAFHNPFALNLDLSSYILPPYLQGRPVRELLHYHDHRVATLMPWVDSPNNPWRKLMLPLALQSPSQSLLLALLALSAEHYSSRPDVTWPEHDGFVSSNYRDRSLQILAQDLRTELGEDASPTRQAQASGILATILVLCNLEMIRCNTATWRVHWKAARTITRRWTAPHLPPTVLDETCRFLLKEAFIYDVFGSSTTFGDNDQIPSSVLTETDANVFTDWLQLVQDVTRAERARNDNPSASQTVPLDLQNMHSLQQRFEYARDRSRLFSQSFNFGMSDASHDFMVLIDIFHYAGLIYSFHALLDSQDPAVQAAIETNVGAVIDTIGQIQNTALYEHDLVWPLFMVGAQSRHNKSIQTFAETKLLEVMNSTGFSNCYPALDFLQRFWETDPSVIADWMQLARQESQQGQHFLVI
ncbi:hypothetical protein H2200_005805 [Cladophialophora chaetospira]|uniref:Zn(2)-C6 fungal-type domain-containing protein n=1 Tax=Cladophialophora chaetospira TaxID=386627 RepID=A0AA39CHY4_9EURO|nr:hypothetical protein H2200_005805 [Cladophialophora chaetospira]